MRKKILVPLDGSELAEMALPLACELVEASKAELILMRIIEYPYSHYPPYYDYPPSDPEIANLIAKKERMVAEETSNYLKQVMSAIGDAGTNVSAEVCGGPVVDSILEAIKRLHIDLVVLSTYGQGGGTQGMIGAVANRVMRESQVPVVLVRPVKPSANRASDISSERSRIDLPRHFVRSNQSMSVRRSRRFDGDSDHLPTGA